MKQAKDKKHYIYCIASAKNKDGPCKLGISFDPDRRMKQLQTAQSEKLCVYHREEVEEDKVKIFEKLLHRDIFHHRLSGEWFNISVDDAIAHILFTIIHYGDVKNLTEKFRRGLI